MAAPMEKTRTPGVYKRGSRYVYVVYVNGKQRKRSARNFTQARDLRAAWIAQVKRDGDLEESRAPFRDYAEKWIERYAGRRRGFSQETRAEYRRDLERYAYPFFDDHLGRRLTKITPMDVSEWIAWLRDPKAQGRRYARERGLHEHPIVRKKAGAVRVAGVYAAIDSDGVAAGRELRRSVRQQLPDLDAGEDAWLLRAPEVQLSDATVRRILAPVRACMATARQENLIHHNPLDGAVLPVSEAVVEEATGAQPAESSGKAKAKALSREQLRMFLTVVRTDHQLTFRFLASTGLRWSELAGLRWGDLELSGSRPTVRVRRAIVKGRVKPPKSKYGRRDVPLVADLVFDLRRRHTAAEFAGDQDLVFSSPTGKPLDYSTMYRRVLKPAVEEAGAGWAGFHAFRHTFASLLFHRGASVVQVSRYLGHHSPSFTFDRYVHLLPGDEAEPLDLGAELGVATRVATQATGSDRDPVVQDDGPARLADARRAEPTETQG